MKDLRKKKYVLEEEKDLKRVSKEVGFGSTSFGE